MSTPDTFTPSGTSKSDLTDARVNEWRTTLFKSPDCSAVPDKSVNFFCWSMARRASVEGAQVPLALRKHSSPSDARMLVTNVRRSGSENEDERDGCERRRMKSAWIWACRWACGTYGRGGWWRASCALPAPSRRSGRH